MNRKSERKAAPIRDLLAVDAAKAVTRVSRLTGHQGSSLPGRTAMKVYPAVLSDLAGQVRKTIFAVCGTNGKTTTNNILCMMLEAEGAQVVCNRLGANMPAGVTGAFTAAASAGGRLHADYACIEIDEASAMHVMEMLQPDYLILTNLFRDQLDRYGEIDTTLQLLQEAIRQAPEMKLIVNADDPLSVYLAETCGNKAVYYGINERTDTERTTQKAEHDSCRAGESGEEIREGRFCKRCSAPLHYDYYHFGQMGQYHCSACGFTRPFPEYGAVSIRHGADLGFMIGEDEIRAPLRGIYSVYNLLAVWSALREDGHDMSRFNRVLEGYRPQFGRNEVFRIKGQKVTLNLAKNPAGFNQNIDVLAEDPAGKDLVIVINDNAQDGRDVSWLWDVDFEKIEAAAVRSIIVSGLRGPDMQLRLKYAGIRAEITPTAREAVERLLNLGSGNLYVLVNYTALFDTHAYLQKKAEAAGNEDAS